MARIDLNIPSLGGKFIDIRDTTAGDSFNWSWVRPLSQVNFLAIHHSAGLDTQTPDEIANYHINNNGWGGIGYHFLIAKNGEVFYVGDISTARANVANLNEQVIGVCLIGNFISGKEPTKEQLNSAHLLCDFFINNFPDLTNITSWEAVKGHKDLPNQSTICPGDSWPSWCPRIVEDATIIPPSTPFPPPIAPLQDQISNLQASLSAVNQQVFSLQQVIEQKDRQIEDLKQFQPDDTLTIVGVLINLYSFLFPPRKEF